MSATIDQARDDLRHELRSYRRRLAVATCSHHSSAIRRALFEVENLERLEEDLAVPSTCDDCDRDDCRGFYKPDGDHGLAF